MFRISMQLVIVMLFLAMTQCQSIPGRSLNFREGTNRQVPLIDRVFFVNRFSDGVKGETEETRKVSPDGHYLLGNMFGRIVISQIKNDGLPFHQPDWQAITPDSMTATTYSWAREGRYVIFETYGKEGGGRRVHVVKAPQEVGEDSEKPKVRALTPAGLESSVIAMPRNTPEEVIVAIENTGSVGNFDLYSINLRTGNRTLEVEANAQVDLLGVGSEGSVRMARRQNHDGSIDLVRVEGGNKLGDGFYHCDWAEICDPLSFANGEGGLYVKSNKGGKRDLSALFRVDMETGRSRLVHQDPMNRVDLKDAVFSERNGQLLATAYDRGAGMQWYGHTPEMKEVLAFLREKFPKGNIRLTPQSSRKWLTLVEVSGDVNAGKTYLLDGNSMTLKRLEDRTDLPSEHLASMKKIEFEARDGMEIPAYMTLPKGKHPKNLPVVVLIHGGPWARDSWGFNAEVQFLANRGYAVFQPNFRGSKGFGKQFLNSGNREWGRAMQDDITDGVRYLIEQDIADPDRICIMGKSYGGYAAMAGLAFMPDLYQCGISVSGPSNLVTHLGSQEGVYRFKLRRRVGDVSTKRGRKALRAISPYLNADQIEAPLLLAHGGKDSRVNKCESAQMAHVLKEQGEIVEYLLANDEGHTFQLKENQVALYTRIEAFLADHLGGRYQKDMPDYAAERIKELTVEPNDLDSSGCPGFG